MTPDDFNLTRKEITILRYTAQGANARAISAMMGIKVRTVHYFYANIKRKLGVTSMEEVMFIAGRDDLLGEYTPEDEV